jgi:hypothetical protein
MIDASQALSSVCRLWDFLHFSRDDIRTKIHAEADDVQEDSPGDDRSGLCSRHGHRPRSRQSDEAPGPVPGAPDRSELRAADRAKYIAPGETKVLADIKGPAVIRHIWLTFSEARPNWLESGGSAAPDEIVLRMYWDSGREPAVEAPLGDFFGAGFGRRLELKSVPVQVETGDGYNCFWPMPFLERGLITVTNEGAKNVRSFYYHLDYTEEPDLAADTAYFCAQYNQAFPERSGGLPHRRRSKGRGHYVGTVMRVHPGPQPDGSEGDVTPGSSTAKPSPRSRAPGQRIISSCGLGHVARHVSVFRLRLLEPGRGDPRHGVLHVPLAHR